MATRAASGGPARSGGEPPLEFLLRQLQQAMRAAGDEVLRRYRLTVPQAVVLLALQQSPGLSNAELARASFVTPQSMGGLLAGLEAAGLVARHPHPRGGRALLAELTPKGGEVLEACQAAMGEIESRLLAELPADEQRQLRRLLERCVVSLREAVEES